MRKATNSHHKIDRIIGLSKKLTITMGSLRSTRLAIFSTRCVNQTPIMQINASNYRETFDEL